MINLDILFLFSNSIKIDTTLFVAVHLGFIASSIIYFSLYGLKSSLKEKIERSRLEFLSEVGKNTAKKKDDLFRSKFNLHISKMFNNAETKHLLFDAEKVIKNLFLITLIGIISVLLLVLYSFFPINLSAILIVILTIASLSYMVCVSWKFKNICLYDPDKFKDYLLDTVNEIDNYPLISDKFNADLTDNKDI